MTLRKKILVSTFVFVCGFLTHALVFPDVLTNGIIFIPELSSEKKSSPESGNQTRSIFTTILFDGKHLSRTNVTLRASDYIIIKNTSKTDPMWLLSDTKSLATNRDYGESEQLRKRMDKKGTYSIQEKYSGQRIVVTVK